MAGNNTHAVAGKLAQLLGEVLIHHAPWTAEIAENAKAARVECFLEEMEQHTAQALAPLFVAIRQTGKVPPELGVLFDAVADPTAQVGAIVQQFLIFGIGFSVASQIAQPFLQSLANELWSLNTSKPLAPPDIATGVIRGIEPGTVADVPIPGWATTEAAKSGVSQTDMQFLSDISGSPPDATSLFEMIRRGIISEDQLVQAMQESDLRDSWIPFFTMLRYVTPTPLDMVRAAVQNQLDYATADSLAAQLGLEPSGYVADNPDWFQLLYNIAGRPPGPEQMLHLANRGYVPFTGTGPDSVSVQQAIDESDIKDKYATALLNLATWWPSVSEAKTLYHSGSIDIDQTQSYWQAQGVPSELLPALVHQATIEQVAQERALAKGDITTLLYDGIISSDTATSLLADIGYDGQVGQYIIEITSARRAMRILEQSLRRIGSAYTSYKATSADTLNALTANGIPSDQAAEIMAIWNAERAIPDRLPSVSELAKAVQYSGLPFATAVAKAELLGYSNYDATLVIAAGAEMVPPQGWPDDDNVGVDV